MENKFLNKNIFESGFDSFEFDDGFLMRLDSDLRKNKIGDKQHDVKKFSSKSVDCQDKKADIKSQCYYDLPLFIEDLDESDFFDYTNNKSKKQSSKVLSTHKNEKPKKASLTHNPNICLSPILGPKSRTPLNLSSSTPIKPNDSNPGEKKATEKNSEKNFDYVYSEADLFDDWDIDEPKKEGTPKSTVTLSQALQLIEEAESAKDSDQKESLNQSINLLTGEVVGVDVGVMLEESFDVCEPATEKQKDADSSCDSVVIVEESKTSYKPTAAQKLNFDKATDKENRFVDIFNSDDDFDFLTQDLLEKPKCVKTNPDLSRGDRASPLKNCDLNESMDAIVRFKKRRGNCFKIIESDTTEDSPSPKFRRRITSKKRKNCQGKFGKEFIDLEAEVSDEVEVSSDEADEEGEYDRSFLDEDSYCTQNQSANMTSRYLESVKGLSGPGNYKIPAPKPYIPDNVFSQIPEENDTDYEIDSFCVKDVEEEMKTDLSDLEIAEKVLEMDRKKRKRKRLQQQFRKFK